MVNYVCVTSSNSIITLAYPGSGVRSSSFSLAILNIINPANTADVSLTYDFIALNGTVLSTITRQIKTLKPSNLLSCSVSFNPSTVMSTSESQIIIQINNPV